MLPVLLMEPMWKWSKVAVDLTSPSNNNSRATIFLEIILRAVVKGLFLKERICSQIEQILPFKSSPLLNGREIYPEKSNLTCNLVPKPSYDTKIPQNIGSKLLKQATICRNLVNSGLKNVNPGYWAERNLSGLTRTIPSSWSPCNSIV